MYTNTETYVPKTLKGTGKLLGRYILNLHCSEYLGISFTFVENKYTNDNFCSFIQLLNYLGVTGSLPENFKILKRHKHSFLACKLMKKRVTNIDLLFSVKLVIKGLMEHLL